MGGKYKIVMYGASGHARAMAAMLRRGVTSDLACEVLAFIDDFTGGHGVEMGGVPVLSFDQWRRDYPQIPCVMIMGSPSAKAKLHAKILKGGGTFADIYRQRPPDLYDDVQIGTGCFVGDHCFIGTQTTIGDHVQILPLCSVGHDVTIGNYCTLCPSTTISGYVEVEEGVFIGAGSTIVNGRADAPLRIGRGATIWAGSLVTRSIEPKSTVAGNPAVPLRTLVRRRRALADG